MRRVKRKLAIEPPLVGDRYRVTLEDGSHELYGCALDASRAQSAADSDRELRKELEAVKKRWVAEFAAAARSPDGHFGHVTVVLSSIRRACLPLLLEDAIARSTIAGCVSHPRV
jgi:hypothetical protein